MDFVNGLKYPWNRPKGLLNVLWLLLPIYGWFGLVGYFQRIIRSIVNGENALPVYGSSLDNFVNGIFLCIKLIPLTIVYYIVIFIALLLNKIPFIGWLLYLAIYVLVFLIMTYLCLHFFNTGNFKDSFAIGQAYDRVTKNFGSLLLAIVFTIGFLIIYGLLSIVIVGIPAYLLGNIVYLADWYRENQ